MRWNWKSILALENLSPYFWDWDKIEGKKSGFKRGVDFAKAHAQQGITYL